MSPWSRLRSKILPLAQAGDQVRSPSLANNPYAVIGVPIALVVAAALLRWLLLGELGTRFAFITFYPAVAIAALFGGMRTGATTTILSTLTVCYFWTPPAVSFTLPVPYYQIAIAAFLLIGLFISWTAERSKRSERAYRRAEAGRREEVERQVIQRTAELVQTTEAFRQVIEYAPTAMIMIDAQGVIELVNGQTEQVFGYSRQELVGRTIDLLLPERFRGLHMKHRDAYLAAPTRRAMGKGQDVFGLRKGGCEFPIEIGLSPLQTPNGVRVISTIVDISYRRDIERAQSESEEQVARMLSSIQDHAIVMLDTAGCVVSWNAGAERLIGYTKEQIIGQHFSLFHLPDAIAAQRPERELIAAAAEGRVEDESWRRRGDGSRFIANVVINAVRAPNGDLCGFVKVTRDITQRKRMEDVLLQANELFAVAAAAAGLGFWEYDIATQSTRWDAQMFKMFHLPPEPSDRFAARRHHVHPDDRSRIEEEVRDAAEGRAKLDTEYRVVLGDGQIRHMKSVASIKRDSIAAGARLLGVTFDITERKEIEGSSLK